MKYVYGLAILCSIVLWSSCRNDFESVPSTGNLEFSRDTVFLDTIFTNIGSSTYNLKVYNRSDEDINIPTVGLAQGEASRYRLNVDGLPGKTFSDIQIMAKDSIFIFVETTADINELPTETNNFLYTDQIVFDAGGSEQEVELVTLVQDAVFLFPDDLGNGMVETLNLGTDGEGNDILIEGFFLDDSELIFTNEKPYVIYGYAAVPPGRTLNVEAGARIHFHRNSGILVANGGTMIANGLPSTDPEALENQIIFEGDRLEPEFSDIVGQWGAIWLTSGSTNNQFRHTTIKNGTVGLLMENNDGDETLRLENVQIYNSANYGILARTANIYGENVVINNSGESSLACSIGGTYTFNHCTFANYWTNSFRNTPTVSLDNVLNETQGISLQAEFNNCIIYGNELRELGLFASEDASASFTFNFSNSLIRFEDPQDDFSDNPLYQFEDNIQLYTNVVLNLDPVFQNTNLNNFNIESGTSAADGIANPSIGPSQDITGASRSTTAPDAGAYESTVFPDPED
ncbi:hypothetical protein [Cochleicola gelatinilyticus]|uniref:Right handed beta helix domain-containing protein n=1 Tax=Cochleicola gelatinilyticus TaxID=1763537 RepID=A0A167HFM9_9FLAO|nr:hypothetical protein [Cochleicola gelatinilyticus]OAB78555.1 hypothetical protein ULVI_08160 [Cochleicola gelatinilyticus]